MRSVVVRRAMKRTRLQGLLQCAYPFLYNRSATRRKPIAWMGDSRVRLQAASANIRSDVGYQLDLIQQGAMPTDFKPMPDVGSGVMEIRVHASSEYRVFYVARFEEAVYVLHCFVKKLRSRGKPISTWAGNGTRLCLKPGDRNEREDLENQG